MKENEVMLKRSGNHETAISLLLIGGHSVASTLMEKQVKIAIYRSLGVAICVLIFVLIQALIASMHKENGDS
jgi:hypothetical protein